MLHGLEVTVDGATQTRIHAGVNVAMEARRLNIGLLGHQQEYVGLGGLGDEVELLEHGASDVLRGRVDDELRVDVDKGRPLAKSQQGSDEDARSGLPEKWASS